MSEIRERWIFFLNPHKSEALEYAKEMEVFLAGKGVEVKKCYRTHDKSKSQAQEWSWKAEGDLVLVLGGDGTFYKAAQIFRDIPIITVNFGTRGFLCAFKPWPVNVLYERIKLSRKLGKYINLDTLELRFNGRSFTAVGDVAVVHSDPGKVIRLDLEIEGSRIHSPSDGVVISTSTGATGYAISAGGPLVEMGLKVMIISHIASQNLALRPIVLSLDKVVRIWNVSKVQEALLLVDGETVGTLKPRESAEVRRGKEVVKLLVPPDFSVFERWKEMLRM